MLNSQPPLSLFTINKKQLRSHIVLIKNQIIKQQKQFETLMSQGTAFLNKRVEKFIQSTNTTNGCLVLYSGKSSILSKDTHQAFQVNKNFYYFTHLNLENCFFILLWDTLADGNICIEKYLLPSSTNTLWDGIKYTNDQMSLISNTNILSNTEPILKRIIEFIYIDSTNHFEDYQLFIEQNFSTTRISNQNCYRVHIQNIMNQMRMIKDDLEIEALRVSALIGSLAHMQLAYSLMSKELNYEYQAQSVFEFHCNFHQAPVSYLPIVASGSNGCVLHYKFNHSPIDFSKFLLVDAGCSYNQYASDITRCYTQDPSRIDSTYIQIYNIVLKAQQFAIKMLPFHPTITQLNHETRQFLLTELIQQKILPNERAKSEEILKELYPHSVGHYLGLDVHDDGIYSTRDKNTQHLPNRIVYTIEPGLYFSTAIVQKYNLDPALDGLAIRIEDDVLIFNDQIEVLSRFALH